MHPSCNPVSYRLRSFVLMCRPSLLMKSCCDEVEWALHSQLQAIKAYTCTILILSKLFSPYRIDGKCKLQLIFPIYYCGINLHYIDSFLSSLNVTPLLSFYIRVKDRNSRTDSHLIPTGLAKLLKLLTYSLVAMVWASTPSWVELEFQQCAH